MLGWEFPPNSIGGLGRVCYHLVKNMSQKNVSITFIMPKGKSDSRFGKVISLEEPNVKIERVDSILTPYLTSEQYRKEVMISGMKKPGIYGRNLFEEVRNYTKRAVEIAAHENFDLIHAHDWMTFGAGTAIKKLSGKPLVAHVHSTEFDRSGENMNRHVYNIEKEGLEAADSVIAVSHYMKDKIVKTHGIRPEKIKVVHNAVNHEDLEFFESAGIRKDHRIVLFLGRVTMQKGPDYFLRAAKRVLERRKDIKFVVAGSGDMESYLIEKAAEMGIADSMLFTGYLKEEDINRIYQLADVYVLPSVSEPFGITVLEAIRNGVPTIVSKNSGVTEVVRHCLKVDFWDIDEMSNKVLALLDHNVLHEHLKHNGLNEVRGISWDASANNCIEVYKSVVGA